MVTVNSGKLIKRIHDVRLSIRDILCALAYSKTQIALHYIVLIKFIYFTLIGNFHVATIFIKNIIMHVKRTISNAGWLKITYILATNLSA